MEKAHKTIFNEVHITLTCCILLFLQTYYVFEVKDKIKMYLIFMYK